MDADRKVKLDGPVVPNVQPAHVYEGEPDARQTTVETVDPKHSLFRKRYRALTPDEVALHDAIKTQADVLAQLFRDVLDLRLPTRTAEEAGEIRANVQLGTRHLEDAVYRAVKGLTA